MILFVFISKVEFDHAFMVWWNEKQKISNHGFSTSFATNYYFNFEIFFRAMCIVFEGVELRDLFKQIREDFNGGDLQDFTYQLRLKNEQIVSTFNWHFPSSLLSSKMVDLVVLIVGLTNSLQLAAIATL